MKLATSILATTVSASHYRGGTYKVEQNGGQLKITNTQAWRKDAGGYSPMCEQSDVTGQVSSGTTAVARCTNDACTSQNLKYTALFVGNDYCYGDGVNFLTKPSNDFSFGWNSCCWVSFIKDDGGYKSGGSMQMKMQINDVDNNSPTFKLPPAWVIMAGCPNQEIDLAPADMDGDKVKCRWATSSESGGAFNDGSSFPSLTLDEENCIVHYDGTKDSTTKGVKPIALMMEDFDSNNDVRSSIPVQFLAQVWTPSMNTRSIGEANYPQWFPDDDHKEDSKHEDFPIGNIRGRRSVPSYCNAVPTFTSATPADGDVLNAKSGSVNFTLQATSENGSITGFSYQAPSGLTCTTVNSAGKITCNWTLTADQKKVEKHQFCYDATDSLGLKTERRCLTIEVPQTITNIMDMASAVLDGSGANGFKAADGNNYGCAGRGMYDFKSTTIGKQVDEVDKKFYAWKKCVQCATSTPVPAYDYDQDSDSCANSSTISRGVCECDRELVNFLYNSKADNSMFNPNHCVPGGSAHTDCCNWNQFKWASFNFNTQCCSNDGVKEIGGC